MADEATIPLNVTLGSSEAELRRAVELMSRVFDVANSLNKSLEQSFGENGAKQLRSVIGDFSTLQRGLKLVQEQANALANELNQSARNAAQTAKAVKELDLQKTSSPRQVAASIRSNDVERVNTALTAQARLLNEIILKEEELNRKRGEADRRGQRQIDTQLRQLERDREAAVERAQRAEARLAQLQRDTRIDRRVQGRVEGVEVSQRFEQTPEGQRIAETKRQQQAYNEVLRQAYELKTKIERQEREAARNQQSVLLDQAHAANKQVDAFNKTYDQAQRDNLAADIRAARRARDEEARRKFREDARPLTPVEQRAKEFGDAKEIDRDNTRYDAMRDAADRSNMAFDLRAARRARDEEARRSFREDARPLTPVEQRTREYGDAQEEGRQRARYDAMRETADRDNLAFNIRTARRARDEEARRSFREDARPLTPVEQRTKEFGDAKEIDRDNTRYDTMREAADRANMAFDLRAARRARDEEARRSFREDARPLTPVEQRAREYGDATAEGRQREREARDAERARRRDYASSPEGISERNTARRGVAQDYLFGDGGAQLLKTQAQIQLQYAAINAVMGAFKGAAHAVVEFDQALHELQAISNASNGEMTKLQRVIIETSTGSKFSATELASAATQMAQTGLGVREITATLGEASTLATATGFGLKDTVSVLTSVFGAFRLQATEVHSVVEQLTAGMNLSKLNMQGMSTALTQVGTVASESGVSLSETVSILATLSNQGITTGSTLATGLRQILLDLENPSAKLKKRMEELGLSLNDIDPKTQTLTGVFENLKKAGFTAADAFEVFEKRAANAFVALLRSTEDAKAMREAMLSSTNATHAHAVAMESLENRYKVLQNNLFNFTNAISGGVVGALKTTVSGLADLTGGVNANNRAWTLLGDVLAGVAIAAVGVRIITLVKNLVDWKAAIESVRAAFVTMKVEQEAATVAGAAAATGGGGALFLGLAAGATALVAILSQFADGSSSASAKTEELKQKVNEAKSAYDETGKSLQAVDEFLEDTINKSARLNTDQQLLNATVLEAQNRFGGLSSSIYGSVRSVDDLIGRVRTLRAELHDVAEHGLLNLQREVQAAVANDKAAVGKMSGDLAVQNVLQKAGLTINPVLGVNPETGTPVSASNLVSSPELNDPTVKRALEIIRSGGSLNQINAAHTDVANNKALSDTVRKAVLDGLGALGNPSASLRQNEAQAQTIEGNLRVSKLTGTAGYGTASNLAESALRILAEQGKTISGSHSDQERKSANQSLQETLKPILAEADAFRTSLSPEGQDDFDKTAAGRLVEQVKAEARRINRETATYVAGNAIKQAEFTSQELSRELGNERAGIGRSRDSKQAAELRDKALSDSEKLANQQRDLLRARIAQEKGSGETATLSTETLAKQETEGLARIDEEARGRNDAINHGFAEVRVREINKQIEAAKAERATAQKEGRKAARGTGKGTEAGTDETRKIVELIRERGRLLGESEDMVNDQIRVATEQQKRAGIGGGAAKAAKPDPSRPITDVRPEAPAINAEIDTIGKRTETAIRQLEIPVRAAQARIEAVRSTKLYPEAEIERMEEQLNKTKVETDKAEAEVLTKEVALLREEQDKAKQAYERARARLNALAAKYGVTLDENGHATQDENGQFVGNFGSERERNDFKGDYSKLSRDADGLAQTVEKAQTRIEGATTKIDRVNAEAGARSDAGNKDIGDAFQTAGYGFLKRAGMTDGSAFKMEVETISGVLDKANSSLASFFETLVTGSGRGKATFSDFVRSFLADAAKIATNQIAKQMLGYVIQGIGLVLGGSGVPTTQSGGSGAGGSITDADWASTGFQRGAGGGLFPTSNYDGGLIIPKYYYGGVLPDFGMGFIGGAPQATPILHFVNGGTVPGTHLGRDSVHALLAPGEAVLNRRAVGLIGGGMIESMNRGAIVKAQAMPTVQQATKRDPDNVNVYVVDKNTTPTLGPKDVLAIVREDVLAGGSTKKLIKQVQVGG